MNIPMKAGMSVCQELLSLENPPGSFAIIAGVGGNYNGFVWGGRGTFRCDVQIVRDTFVGSASKTSVSLLMYSPVNQNSNYPFT